MNKKKYALKGMLALFVVIALCMFFSRTVQTITTPKIQRISAAKGKLEQKISLSGEIYFPVTEEIKIDNAKKLSVKVEKLMTPLLPAEEICDFCHRVVQFGRDVCTARSPQCSTCPPRTLCKHGEGESYGSNYRISSV